VKSAGFLIGLIVPGMMEVRAQLPATENTDSLAVEFRTALSTLTSPALEERKRTRKQMQRNGYAAALLNMIGQDGLTAALVFARMKLHLEYAISHRQLYVHVPVVRGEGRTVALPLSDDWTFPLDPWKRE
jgi:hypothetical protein